MVRAVLGRRAKKFRQTLGLNSPITNGCALYPKSYGTLGMDGVRLIRPSLNRLGKHSHIPQLMASFSEGDYFYLVPTLRLR